MNLSYIGIQYILCHFGTESSVRSPRGTRMALIVTAPGEKKIGFECHILLFISIASDALNRNCVKLFVRVR